MTKEEAIKILEMLYAVYPNFNRNGMKNFNKIWLEKLMQGDYQKTLIKTNEYTEASKYPPALADVFVPNYKPRDDGMAEAIKESEETVRKEKADPVMAAERQRKLDEMKSKLQRLNAYDE